jgi:N-acetylated-alpha-linked acidic dipeptidase
MASELSGSKRNAASLNGVYHSNYDNFAFFSKFSDPDFQYGPALARADGVLALRMANADILPYDVARYGTDTRLHAQRLEELASDRGLDVRLDALKAAASSVAEAGSTFVRTRDARLRAGNVDAATADAVNAELIALEKALLRPEGLQGRPWSRSLYASPDPFSGYASWMLPGLRYEIETDDSAGAREWSDIYVHAMGELEARIRALTARLETAGRSL